jgi:hypothetical protein
MYMTTSNTLQHSGIPQVRVDRTDLFASAKSRMSKSPGEETRYGQYFDCTGALPAELDVTRVSEVSQLLILSCMFFCIV